MNINLTLIVQVFNFLIGYFIISRFLLKPTLKIIEDDKSKLSNLYSSIEIEKEKFEVKERLKKNQWRLCQNYFKTNTPEISLAIFTKKKSPSINQVKKLSNQEVNMLTKEVAPTIKSKLIYD